MFWNFTVTIKNLGEFTDELANRLFESGCSDGVPCSVDLRSYIRFAREASTL